MTIDTALPAALNPAADALIRALESTTDLVGLRAGRNLVECATFA